MRDLREIADCIERCRARPPTLIDSSAAGQDDGASGGEETAPSAPSPKTSALPVTRLGERAG